jgi:hypothetical protein
VGGDCVYNPGGEVVNARGTELKLLLAGDFSACAARKYEF